MGCNSSDGRENDYREIEGERREMEYQLAQCSVLIREKEKESKVKKDKEILRPVRCRHQLCCDAALRDLVQAAHFFFL